ncbi:MAG: cysteine synthase A [Candidatus Izemoplasma sp.]
MIYNNIYDTIGNTPIVKLNKVITSNMADVYLKLEWFNPGGSVKDRIAISMINEAEKSGLLKPGDTIIEPTSGNTGIGIAMIAASKGYKTIFAMPDNQSIERRKIFKAYGAELILTKGMDKAIEVCKDLVAKHGYFMPMQFSNINNPLAHMRNTAIEIKKDLPNLDCFIAAVGTGGTITGVGTILRETNPKILIYAVEPETSNVLSGGEKGSHKIQGIGAGFIPKILDTTIYDGVLTVTDEQAYSMARRLAKEEGLLVGISTGANVYIAIQIAKKLGKGKTVLTVSPSNGERYLSTDLF